MKTAHAGLNEGNPAQSTIQFTPTQFTPTCRLRRTAQRVAPVNVNPITGRAMPKAIWLVGCLAIGFLSIILTVSPAKVQAEEQTDAETVHQLSGSAQEILAAINQHRVNAGLNALVVDPLLNQAAQHHVNDMLANYNYSHRGSDGSSVKTRVARTGYAAEPWVSENWVSSRSTEGAMRWWMNDYIHRVNILTTHWREIGVGVATRANGEMIFVTVFATGRGEPSVQPSVAPAAQPAPAPEPTPAPVPQVDVPPGGMDYTIRSGDTLLGIANRHNLDWRVVAAANGLNEQSILQIGQEIRLPGVDSLPETHFDDDGTTGSTAATEDALDADNSNFEQSSAPAAPPIETQPYTVQSGDTLFSIAARHGITWEELAELNNFREQDYLQIGHSLKVPLRQSNGADNSSDSPASLVDESNPAENSLTENSATETSVAATSTGSPATANENSNNGANYVTREYTPLVLATPANGANNNETSGNNTTGEQNNVFAAGFDQAGGDAAAPEVAAAQVSQAEAAQAEPVAVAQNEQQTAPPPPAEPNVHQVQEGETIISIAVQHGVDWHTLLSLNGLDEQSILQLGQEIRLP